MSAVPIMCGCGQSAMHYVVMHNLPTHMPRQPICEHCTQENEWKAQEVNDHEMRHFGGAYGLVRFHYEPLDSAEVVA